MEIDDYELEYYENCKKNSSGIYFWGFLKINREHYSKLSFEQKKEVLIKYEIFEQLNPGIKYVFTDLLYPHSLYKSPILETENNLFKDDEFIYRGVLYGINRQVVEDVVKVIKDAVEGDDPQWEIEKEIEKHVILLDDYLSAEDKKKYAIEEYYKLLELLKDYEFLIYYRSTDVEYNWEEFVISRIFLNMSIVETHLNNTGYYDVEHLEIYKDWVHLDRLTKVMKFLKSTILDLDDVVKSKPDSLDTRQKVILFEHVIDHKEAYLNLNEIKRAKLVSFLTGMSWDNIKKSMQQTKKPTKIQEIKTIEDIGFIDNLFKNI